MFQAKGIETNRNVPLTSIAPTDSFQTAIDKVVKEKIHRLWVTDENDRPVGIITLGDLIRALDRLNRKRAVEDEKQQELLHTAAAAAAEEDLAAKKIRGNQPVNNATKGDTNAQKR